MLPTSKRGAKALRPTFSRPGDFEDEVRELLEMSGYHVTAEVQFGYKKVDIIAETRSFGKARRIAVECKCYASPLSQKQLTTIYTNYRPLYDAGDIDEILVVTSQGLHPSAQQMVLTARGLSHQCYDELQWSVMDFRHYLTTLVDNYAYEADGLPEYYVPLLSSLGSNLQELVSEWIHATHGDKLIMGEQVRCGMAMLGAYGVGKTSFALHLSDQLARAAIVDCAARIPVLIRLGDIASEQSLEGLLGKSLTAGALVRNYSFDSFMRLNRRGRFVLILDGFDEMKHTMSWEEFKHNFRQLNRLVADQSRVLLLGRPTAFLNDAEHQLALHGTSVINDRVISEAGWPDYLEVEIASLSPAQVERFLRDYLTYQAKQRGEGSSRKVQKSVERQVTRVKDHYLRDIAKRPVQLKMLAEVLPSYSGDLNKLDAALLYALFIDKIIERDAEKLTRRRFNTPQRRLFARKLAWWLWTERREMKVTAEAIPISILSQFCREEEDVEAVRRDLVSACFLDRKVGNSLYFPHRSFQEFLVAEEALELITSAKLGLEDAEAIVNDEVASFMSLIAGEETLRKLHPKLQSYRGPLSWRMARLWLADGRKGGFLLANHTDPAACPWYTLFLTVGTCTGVFRKESGAGLFTTTEALSQLRRVRSPQDVLVLFLCVLVLSEHESQYEPIGEAIHQLCSVGTIMRQRRENVDRKRDILVRGGTVNRVHRDKWFHVLVPSPGIAYTLGRLAVNRRQGRLDLRGAYPALASSLREYCMISDWLVGRTLKPSDVALPQIVTLEDWSFQEVMTKYAIKNNFLE